MSAIIARARSCIGARFRLHGRDPATGLDCVGLAAFALDRSDAPGGYALRGGDAVKMLAMAETFALQPCIDQPGSIQLVRAGPAQLHLIIRSDTGFIHADVALRRIVERPGPPPWPVLACWRPKED